MVFEAREFGRAAVSAVRMAYKSLPRVCVVVKSRDGSISRYDNLTTRLLSLPLRCFLNY